MAGTVLEFSFVPTPEERAAAAVGMDRARPLRRWGRGLIVTGAMGVAVGVLVIRGTPDALVRGGVLLAVVLLTMFVVQPFLVKVQAREAARIAGPTEDRWTVDEMGFHVRGARGSVGVPWERITRAVEIDGLLLLSTGPRLAYFVPLRALDATQVATLRRIVGNALGPRATLASSPS